MSSLLQPRNVLGLLGVVLVVVAAALAGWLVQPGYGPTVVLLLLGAAALSLSALLMPPPAADDDGTVDAVPATAAAAEAAPDPQLLAQIEALRQAQSDLLVAKQTSEAAMLAKGEFLATMSHEIRTPLNGVLPLLELLLSTPLSADQREHLATAFRSAQEMLRIVDDILDYSKLDAGKLELESIGLNLRELVESVAQLMRRSAEAKGLRLTFSIDPNVRLAVRGDPVRLRQVLMNLVSNAIKFTERGAITVLVSRRGETASAHEITFAVRDTGIGIDAAAAAKLFQPFAQGDASIRRAFGGTGLGLVICKRVVDLMGGRIGVQSERGRGSLFWFSVPLLKVVGDLGAQRGLQGLRVLTVSADEPFTRRLQTAFANLGAHATAVTSASDALVKLRGSVAMGAHWEFALVAFDATEPAKALAFARSVLADTNLAKVRILLFAPPDDAVALNTVDARVAPTPRSFGDAALRAAVERVLADEAAPTGEVRHDVPPASPRTAAVAIAAPRRLRGRVLLVEDNPVNRHVARRLLERHGLDVDDAGNGEDALQRLATARYDLVLMDCQMPVLDGYAAAQRWRDDERARTAVPLPIVAMTANAMAGDREKCLAAGMDDYLSKPIDQARLQTVLLRWLPPQSDDEGDAAPSKPVDVVVERDASLPRSVESVPADVASAVVPPPADAPLDANVLAEAIDVMGPAFEVLVNIYLDDVPPKLAALEQAAARGDDQTMIATAHTLKSSSANLGARRLAELARRVEEGLRASPRQPMQAHVAAIRTEFARVATALRALGTPEAEHERTT